jgi:hypothetical protein
MILQLIGIIIIAVLILRYKQIAIFFYDRAVLFKVIGYYLLYLFQLMIETLGFIYIGLMTITFIKNLQLFNQIYAKIFNALLFVVFLDILIKIADGWYHNIKKLRKGF